MGGRVSDIAIDPRNPAVFFVGLSTGGLFKTGDNGVTFDSMFDKQPVQSIGAVTVAPSDSDVVWVGTGEPTDRNSAEWGNGVYRSTDGGTTWQHVGLDTSRSIGRVIVHPKNPETAYVAALGNLWVDGGERGVFKTSDGGKSWKPVLAAPTPHNARTGACDLAMAPDNPEIIYAAMYARQRKPWSFTYGVSATGGEDVGGIFKSSNGGGTWKKCTAGLATLTGKIGLAVTPVNPKIVMAVVQSDEGGTNALDDIHSKRGGVFRSEDAGETWKRTSARFTSAKSELIRRTISVFISWGLRYWFRMMVEKLSERIYPKKFIRTCTHLLFKMGARLLQSRQSLKTRTSLPNRQSRSA